MIAHCVDARINGLAPEYRCRLVLAVPYSVLCRLTVKPLNIMETSVFLMQLSAYTWEI